MMSKVPAKQATKKTQEFNQGAMAFLEACIKSEMNSQIHFGEEWGDLVGGPKSLDDAIASKRAELDELRKKTLEITRGLAVDPPSFTSTTRSQFQDALKTPLEAGLPRPK